MEQLKKRLEHEYKVFKFGYLITSKENIFVHAEEITAKVQIYRYLTKQLSWIIQDAKIVEKLLVMDNIIDNAYCFLKEQGDLGCEQLEDWLKKSKSN